MNTTIKHLALSTFRVFIHSTFRTVAPKKRVTNVSVNSISLNKISKQVAGKNTQLLWTLKNGTTIEATLLHVLGHRRCIIEQRSLFNPKPQLIDLSDVLSIVQIGRRSLN